MKLFTNTFFSLFTLSQRSTESVTSQATCKTVTICTHTQTFSPFQQKLNEKYFWYCLLLFFFLFFSIYFCSVFLNNFCLFVCFIYFSLIHCFIHIVLLSYAGSYYLSTGIQFLSYLFCVLCVYLNVPFIKNFMEEGNIICVLRIHMDCLILYSFIGNNHFLSHQITNVNAIINYQGRTG